MARVLEEKRQSERIEVQLSVDMKTKYIYTPASVLNVSPSGMFIKTLNPLPEGSKVDIIVHIDRYAKPRHFKGVVRWGNANPRGSTPAGMGVAFISPDKNLLTRIARDIKKKPKSL
jgi:uncharacterized protein (TIGR02266 family)